MGTWDSGLLDNDSAADAIGDVMSTIASDAAAGGKGAWTKDRAVRFCAQLALLVRFHPWFFEDDGDKHASQLRDLLCANRTLLDEAAPNAKTLFDNIVRGVSLDDPPPFQALLQGQAARSYLQKLADEFIDEVEGDLEHAGAYLALLCFLAPHVDLPGKTVRHWHRRIREVWSEADDEEREFVLPYVRAYKKLVEAAGENNDDEQDDE